MYVIAHPLMALVSILNSLLFVYSIIVLATIVLSFVSPDPYNPIVRILRNLTEPVLVRIRKYVPSLGSLDLSPLVLLIGIAFIQQGFLPIIREFAARLLH